MRGTLAWLLVAAMISASAPAIAQPASPSPAVPDVASNGPEEALTQRIGVWRIDALGMDAELVARLESLFRMELERLAKLPIASRHDVDLKAGKELRDCTGGEKCLAAIGKKLSVDVMVTGSVAALGDSYILDIKAVDVHTGKQLRRIATDPLRGSPDELIEAIRVAAYRLLAPEQLHGSIILLSDLIGANVTLDGAPVGKTPLPAPLTRQALGRHTLRVQADGYMPFDDNVDVHFQKTTRVVVHLISSAPLPLVIAPIAPLREAHPWYSHWYVYAAVGAVAILAGAVIGKEAGKDTVTPCSGTGIASNGC